ncbi:MAG: ABC transporter permease [Thermomicrobiales bacterium]|nr:ABC transporter permease [Thermomicrobiales bacterium]MCO5219908.1 ABC transporter permease [Thermomicrobiales bacterium]MCO5224184.1 ABC transporter permease [Thermomicrobiales bacterium]MCO5229436.1 ABC transporter permease [Thermomicrobiales bacterium]
MLSYLIKRLLQGGLVLFLVTFFTFTVMFFMPGDPARTMVGQARVTEEQLELIREKWHLNDGFFERYWSWISNLLTGDLGTSMMRPGQPISDMIGNAAGFTIRLTSMSMLISLMVAIPIGVLAATRRNSPLDYFSTLGSTLGVAIPNYWIGIMAIVLFSVKLGWLPPYGADSWKAYILPVLVLSIEEMAAIMRLIRGTTIEILGQDYVKTAQAKGLHRNVVLTRHVVRNSMLPVITLIGYRMAFILSGTIVIETVFSWPGIGQLFFDAISNKDLQVVQAIVLLLTCIVVIMNILTDMMYAVIDPRVRVR